MDDNQSIAEHYTHGSLERAIFEALSAAGKDLDRLDPADLAPVDEFHIGGRQATTDFADRLDFGPDLHLLDIGSGLGGASRYFAQERRSGDGLDLQAQRRSPALRGGTRTPWCPTARAAAGPAVRCPHPTALICCMWA